MDGDKSAYFQNARELVRQLKAALKAKSAKELRQLASATHFSVGGAVCGGWFTQGDMYLDALIEDAKLSPNVIMKDAEFDCCGEKQGLWSDGWQGNTFVGPMLFMVERCAYGWSWTGLAVVSATPAFRQLQQRQFGLEAKRGNQPPEIALKAPWPADTQNFSAGGFHFFLGIVLTVGLGAIASVLILAFAFLPGVLAGILAGAGAAAAGVDLVRNQLSGNENVNADELLGLFFFATIFAWVFLVPLALASECGFGVLGFYYGDPLSHIVWANQDSYFAIDFARHRWGFPFLNSGSGEIVLTVADGIVAYGTTNHRDFSSTANVIEVIHFDRSQFAELAQALLENGGLTGAPGDSLLGANIPRRDLLDRIKQRRAGRRLPRLREDWSTRGTATAVGGIGAFPSRGRRNPLHDPADPNGENVPIGSWWDGPRDPSGRPNGPMRSRDPIITTGPVTTADHAQAVDPNRVFVPERDRAGYGPEGPRNPDDPNDDNGNNGEPITHQRYIPPARTPIPEFGRYSSRYMHMQPGSFVSLFQLVLQGTPLARIGNTGRSAIPHLHFELHDALMPRPFVDPLGATVRPSPMDVELDGSPQWLHDGAAGKCCRSTNTIVTDVVPIFPYRR